MDRADAHCTRPTRSRRRSLGAGRRSSKPTCIPWRTPHPGRTPARDPCRGPDGAGPGRKTSKRRYPGPRSRLKPTVRCCASDIAGGCLKVPQPGGDGRVADCSADAVTRCPLLPRGRPGDREKRRAGQRARRLQANERSGGGARGYRREASSGHGCRAATAGLRSLAAPPAPGRRLRGERLAVCAHRGIYLAGEGEDASFG